MGGRLAQHLVAHTTHEIILGSRTLTDSPAWLPQIKVVQTLWNSPSELEDICENVDAVVHMAGMNAQECATNSAAAFEMNAVATARLVQAAAQKKVKRFIYLSTAHVYGSPLVGVIDEKNCPVSIHPYATSHRAGEDVVRAAHQNKEIDGIVVRLSNSFGAPAHRDVNCWMLLVNDLCRQAITTERMVLRSSGQQHRDFITLTNTCRAIEYLLVAPSEKLGDGLFNVGGAWSPTIFEMTQKVAERIYALTGSRPEIRCEVMVDDEPQESLDYKNTKLVRSGFLSIDDNVDQEIDQLIKFCMVNFS